ncbi:Asp domain protein [Ceratobasidium sp. AG-Ba]|nr:Asp domain protein [Ceratobasidium sp. AG-Ba]
MSSAVLPPTYSSDELPNYSQSLELERSPAYSALTLTPSTSRSGALSPALSDLPLPATAESGKYVFNSKRLTLDLGQRIWSTKLPTYGRNALIEGRVGIKTFKHVDRVELSLVGVVLTYMMSNGNPTLRSSRTVLSEKSTIWSADSDSCSSDGRCPSTFPFVFGLPDYVNGAGPYDDVTTPLPPSSSITTRSANGHVFYMLKVDMFRRGMRFHDSVQTEILYLPKTLSRYERPYIPLPGSEKPRRICDEEWRTSPVPLKPSPSAKPLAAFKDVDVHLSLPHKLNYPSGCTVQFAVTLSGDGLSCANIPQLTAGMKMSLVRIHTTVVQGIVSKSESEVAVGTVCRIDEDERHWRNSKPGDNTRQVVIRGCIMTGTKGREQSWGVRGFAGVAYQVRVRLAPTLEQSHQLELPVWEHSEAVVITSHEWEGSRPDSSPAMQLTAAARTPMSISLLNML